MDEPHCQRCGTCCRNGGPALHSEDAVLYRDQILQKNHLLTLRRGEWVYDNVQGRVEPLEQEILRVAGKTGSQVCIFFQDSACACAIYARRPLECRTLNCQAPEALASLYAHERLTRFDLIAADSGLGELMTWHETVCAYSQIADLCARLRTGNDPTARQELEVIVRKDSNARQTLREKGALDEQSLRFVFGRPCTETLPAFGVRVVADRETVQFLV